MTTSLRSFALILLIFDCDSFCIRSYPCVMQVQHLVNCRHHCMGMGNLIKYIRYEISHVAPDLSEADAKVKTSFL